MLKTRITDGMGSNFGAQVTERGHALLTTTIPPDPRDIPFEVLNIQHFQNGFLQDSAGSADLTINGTVTPTQFGIYTQQDQHLFVETIIITIHSSGMKLDSNEIRNFGAAGVLGNGIDLVYRFAGEEFNLLGNNVTVLSQFYRYMDEVTGVTDGISAGVDLLVMKKRFTRPLPIESASDDRMVIDITDDLSGIALFEVEYEGYHALDGRGGS